MKICEFLQNIYNEFVIYKETICIDQDLKLSDETMMALIIFKNLYPQEFAELQMERGVVKQAFEDKQRYISEQCMQWKNKIDKFTLELEKYHDDCLERVKELKIAMLSAMVDWQGISYSIKKGYWGDEYFASEIMKDSFELAKLEHLEDVKIKYYTWSHSQLEKSVDNFQEVFKQYQERIKNFQFVQKKGVSSIKSEIEDLKKNIHKLSSWSLKKLIEEFGVYNVLSEKVSKNKLLVLMVYK